MKNLQTSKKILTNLIFPIFNIFFFVKDDPIITRLEDKIKVDQNELPLNELKNLSNEINEKKEIIKIEYKKQALNNKERMETAFEFLSKRENIEELNLSNNSINTESLSHLVSLIKRRSERLVLKSLKLNENKLDSNSSEQISELLKNSDIEELDLSNNPDLKSLDSLFALLPNTKVRSIALGSLNLLETDIKNLCEMIKKIKTLTSLNLSNNKWVSNSLKEIAKSMEVSDCITSINFSGVNLNHKSIKLFCEYLRGSFKKEPLKVRELDLSGTSLKKKSFTYLSSVFQSNKIIEVLRISNTKPTIEFFGAIGKSNLKVLDISRTDFNCKLFEAFTKSMEEGTKFFPTELTLSFLIPQIIHLQDLFSVILQNKKLKSITIMDADFRDKSKVKAIHDYLLKNPFLSTLDISKTKVSSNIYELFPVFSINNNLEVIKLPNFGKIDEKRIESFLNDSFSLKEIYVGGTLYKKKIYKSLEKTENRLSIRGSCNKNYLGTGVLSNEEHFQKIEVKFFFYYLFLFYFCFIFFVFI